MSSLQTFHNKLSDPVEQKNRQIESAAEQLPLVLVRTLDQMVEGVNAITQLMNIDQRVASKLDEKSPNMSTELLAARDKLRKLIIETLPDMETKLLKVTNQS